MLCKIAPQIALQHYSAECPAFYCAHLLSTLHCRWLCIPLCTLPCILPCTLLCTLLYTLLCCIALRVCRPLHTLVCGLHCGNALQLVVYSAYYIADCFTYCCAACFEKVHCILLLHIALQFIVAYCSAHALRIAIAPRIVLQLAVQICIADCDAE